MGECDVGVLSVDEGMVGVVGGDVAGVLVFVRHGDVGAVEEGRVGFEADDCHCVCAGGGVCGVTIRVMFVHASLRIVAKVFEVCAGDEDSGNYNDGGQEAKHRDSFFAEALFYAFRNMSHPKRAALLTLNDRWLSRSSKALNLTSSDDSAALC